MGVSLDSQDTSGMTPLMKAATNCNADNVNILRSGANPKTKDREGRSALHYAAEGGCTESAATLVMAGVGVDEKDRRGCSPAFIAVANNKPRVLQLLVENGADLTLRDCMGKGMLHRAALCGDIEVLNVLLDA
ncbi:serine/threonine-protein phosphatase 6 regulatory ankyrin repeat subunit C-like [Halyomorpha halys]|uniref:serine/threonine-protein phosphatase 6 regulatory ankyrin repeat subunit C-like n=1 Tax=Halyomorpha halys TaxID=286706 RepID=UPI0006D4F1FE|nr:serine/threonine-protein phosphatase 6 regulatory ankyrin repeat subunit C-like [Halyomorpha halys]